MTPTYERVGKMQAESFVVHHDDEGRVTGMGTSAPEVYACSLCRALVWYPHQDDHTAWHESIDKAVRAVVRQMFQEARDYAAREG